MLGMIAKPFPAAFSSGPAAAAAFPWTNLTNNDYGRVGRSTSGAVANYDVVFDLGSAKSVDTVGLFWHNLRATDKVMVRAGATAGTLGGLYDSGNVNAITGVSNRDLAVSGKFLLTLGAPIVAQFWMIRFAVLTSGHPDGFVQGSRAFFGQSQLFQIGPQRCELSAVDLNQRLQIETGEDRATEDTTLIKPIAQLDFSYAKQSEMQSMLAKYTLGLGTSLPMLVVPDLTNAFLQDQILFGRPEGVITQQSEFYDVWKFQARVRSFGP